MTFKLLDTPPTRLPATHPYYFATNPPDPRHLRFKARQLQFRSAHVALELRMNVLGLALAFLEVADDIEASASLESRRTWATEPHFVRVDQEPTIRALDVDGSLAWAGAVTGQTVARRSMWVFLSKEQAPARLDALCPPTDISAAKTDAISGLLLYEHSPGQWEMMHAWTLAQLRNRGLATRLYDYVERHLLPEGRRLEPSSWLTPDAYWLWDKRHWTRIEDYSLFDAAIPLAVSPRQREIANFVRRRIEARRKAGLLGPEKRTLNA